MNDYKKIGRILFPYRYRLLSVSVVNLLSAFFSLCSVAILAPLLSLVFNQVKADMTPPSFSFTSDTLLAYAQYYLSVIITGHGALLALLILLCVVFVSFLLSKVLAYSAVCILIPIRTAVVKMFRHNAYQKMLHLPVSYFSKHKKGDIISLVINDIQEIDTSILDSLQSFLRFPLEVVIYLSALFLINYKLSLLVLVLLPLAGLLINKLQRKLKSNSKQAKEYQSEMTTTIEEGIYALRVIKAFNGIGRMSDYFNRINAKYTDIFIKISRRRDLSSPLGEFSGVLIVVVILLYGSVQVLSQDNAFTAELFITYIMIFIQVINPMKSLSEAVANLKKGMASIERINALLESDETAEQSDNCVDLNEFKDKIVFKNVCFSYGDKEVLSDLNFEIVKGQKTAICGMSGSGKTTIVDLLLRFYDIQSGEILIDGVDIRCITLSSLLKIFGVVSQESILFNDTVYNNITLGYDSSEEAVMQAARMANVTNFLPQLEEGIHTNVGDRGANLSGGQKQRISIARALLRQPEILVLDEATSALDAHLELSVQQAIDSMLSGRTSIVIAHRLATIVSADNIIVINHGRVAEQGSHSELVAKNGLYKHMVDMQSFV
ncbi:MAG: ABC transporter ATP-binding protein [Bacteroidales bacterium]|nr:ABC transporter ATP-binding protein [Bacteroidales bacterium]